MAIAAISDARGFGQAVRAIRKERGFSQRALAERCGCSQRFISELERGKPTAELGKALLVLGELGLTLVVQRECPSGDAQEAVEQLAANISERLMRKERHKTSLADYLEG
ncbi:MAG: helix-turn-helix transcriptional regulator [Atopobiaceae bacterium]|nr:helix-turn-helix transcriptional regulator [Atopobiaceae bacterium]